MFPTSPVKASKDFTRFMLTCGAGITGTRASCMSLCKSSRAFSIASCASSPLRQPDGIRLALGPSSAPPAEPVSHPASSFSTLHSKTRVHSSCIPAVARLHKNLGWSLRRAGWTRSRSGGHPAATLTRPGRNLTPPVDKRVPLQLFLLSNPSRRSCRGSCACSISHVTTLAGADQSLLACLWNSSRDGASGGSRLRATRTLKRSGI